jgi:hypothetical protein
MASRQELEIILKMKADLDAGLGQAIKGLRSLETETKRVADNSAASLKRLDTAFTAFGNVLTAGAIIKGFDMVLKAQGESEAAINKLNIALANQGRYSADISTSLVEYAAALQQVSTYDDETILGAEALLASFGMTEEQIKRSTKAALDYAAATGTDLESAVQLLGKAFAGNVTALQKQGFAFGEGMTAAQKYESALGQLELRYGGQALAATQTYQGQMAQLKNAFNDVEEAAGKLAGQLLDVGGAGGGMKSVLEGVANFFGRDLVIALSEARARVLEFFAGIADKMGQIGKLAGDHPLITRILGGDPKDLAKQGQLMTDFANGLKQQAAQLRDEGDKAAASFGKLATVVNAGQVAITAQERAEIAERSKLRQKAAEEQKKLSDAIFRFQIESAKEGTKRTTEFWKEQERLAGAYGQAILAQLQERDKAEEAELAAAKDRSERRAEYQEGFFRAAQKWAQIQHQANIEATQDFGDLGNAIASLGDALGSAFLSGLGSAISLFSQISVQAQNATTAMQKATVLVGAAASAYKSGSILSGVGAGAAAGAMFGPWGAAIGAVAGGLLGLAGKLGIFGNKAVMETNKARDAFFKAKGGFEAFSQQMAKVSSEDWAKKIFNAKTVEDFNAVVAEAQALLDNQSKAQEALNAAVEKYGFTVDELGPKWAQQKLDEQAGSLLQDYELLIAAGVDYNAIISRMGPAFLEYVNAAVASGASIPEAMRPAMQAMLDAGTLIHENGDAFTQAELDGLSFTQTMTEQFKTLIDSIADLVAALTGIPNVDRTVTVNTQHTDSGGPPSDHGGQQRPAEFARGGIVLPFRRAAAGVVTGGPTRVLMGEAGPEVAAPVAALFGQLADTIAAKVAGGGAAAPVIHVYVGGREVAATVVQEINSGRGGQVKTARVGR